MTADKKNSEFCLEQVRRLSGQDFYRADKIIISQLLRSLMTYAEDRAHVERIITAWIERTREMLHPSNIKELAEQTTNRAVLPEGCAECLGTDFIVVEKDGATGVRRCYCSRGRRLAALDAEYRARTAAAKGAGA